MATENILLKVSYSADADLRTYQYHVVKRTATGVALPAAATDIPLGILQNAPNINEAAVVAVIGCGGISKAVCGATPCAVNELAGLEYVGAGDAGKVNKAVTTQFPLGLCVEPGVVEDDLCSILLAPIHKALTEDLP